MKHVNLENIVDFFCLQLFSINYVVLKVLYFHRFGYFWIVFMINYTYCFLFYFQYAWARLTDAPETVSSNPTTKSHLWSRNSNWKELLTGKNTTFQNSKLWLQIFIRLAVFTQYILILFVTNYTNTNYNILYIREWLQILRKSISFNLFQLENKLLN